MYAFHFGNKYHDKCHSIILINNRRFNKYNYDKTKERILRGADFLEKNGVSFNKKQILEVISDVDNDIYDNQNFKSLLKLLESNKDLHSDAYRQTESLVHDYIMLTLRKQYDKVPTKCVIPTTIYNNITLSLDYMIQHNMKDEYTKHVKQINTESDAIIEHCKTNMDAYQANALLYDNTEPKDLIKTHYYTSDKMLHDPMIKNEIIKNVLYSLNLLKTD